MTADELKTYFQQHTVQMVLPLTNKLTYQLTPTEVKTLLKNNNIWTDVGPVSVEYPADTKLYIDGKIAEAIAALQS